MIFFLASHTLGSKGAFDYFSEYLKSKHNALICISHPLDSYAKKVTTLSVFDTVIKRIPRSEIGILNFVYDTYLTVSFLFKNTCDVYVGANNFDTLSGIIGRYLFWRTYKIVYFASDFSEKRFDNRLLDELYIYVERIALYFSDIVISNTYRAEKKRIELGLTKAKSFVVPNCASLVHEVFKEKKIIKSSFIYVGNITAGSGLIDSITMLKPLIKQLVIIGDSTDWNTLKSTVSKLRIHTKFYRRKSHEFVVSYLQSFEGFGLAPYDDKNHWTYYGSSLKMYDYITCGVPVITSSRTEMATLIKQRSLGIVYDVLSFSTIKPLLQAFQTKDYYKRAKLFYREYNPDTLYGPIIKNV